MKLIVIAALGAVAVATPASAQQAFPGARVVVTAGYDSVNAGLDYENSDFPEDNFSGSETTSGIAYGVTAGYDLRVAPGAYVGVEGNYDLAENERCEEIYGDDALCFEVKDSYALGARFGTRLYDRAMLYAGIAHVKAKARLSYTDEIDPTNNLSEGEWREGLRLSLGAEHHLVRNFLASVEYRYSDFDDFDLVSGSESASLRFERHQILFGLGARF